MYKLKNQKTSQKEFFSWMRRIERLNFREKGFVGVYPTNKMASLTWDISKQRASELMKMFERTLDKS